MRDGSSEHGAIKLAENIFQLLDRGGFVATYKYAVLLGLIDLCLEGTTRYGEAPDMVTTRQLAAKVLELYWPQTRPFEAQGFSPEVLRQNTGTQAKIVSDILAFKRTLAISEASLHQARIERPQDFETLLDSIEWTLILMPLPRLQNLGGQNLPLLYVIAWDESIERQRRMVADYQRGRPSGFDNRISFLPGVASYLVQLNGLLRPLVHREWVRMVAKINNLEVSRLESFLFGPERVSTARLRAALVELQENRCFYCAGKIGQSVEIDHFIPWARYPDNGLDNLVAAHRGCNSKKRDFLAASAHVGRWIARAAPGRPGDSFLRDLARDQKWEREPGRSVGVARGIYLRLPRETMLWMRDTDFEPCEPAELAAIFSAY
jgi:hypothetical protein